MLVGTNSGGAFHHIESVSVVNDNYNPNDIGLIHVIEPIEFNDFEQSEPLQPNKVDPKSNGKSSWLQVGLKFFAIF